MGSLPPQTQMFMLGCSPELEAKIERLQARDLVMRNLFAFSAGVETTMFWDLWHNTSRRDDMMHLMFSKLKLMELEEGGLARRPLASAFERMARALRGLQSARRIAPETDPSVLVFEVLRRDRGLLYVAWQRQDTFSGEDAPGTPFELDWKEPTCVVVGALEAVPPFTVENGRLSLLLSNTPVFIEAAVD